MSSNNDSWLMRQLLNPLRIIIIAGLVVAAVAFVVHDRLGDGRKLLEIEVEHNTSIDLTPQQVRSIERIGQWEFLSIADEELVDTSRQRLLGSDDHLVRIYRGTLRLGLDLSRCQQGWITTSGDTVRLELPPIQLLSPHFIDEARTEAFYESGTWTARDKEAMYQKAARQMRRRALTRDNIRSAEANATEQLTSLMRSFGFQTVEISYQSSHVGVNTVGTRIP